MFPAMIWDLRERVPPLDVPPSEGLASGGASRRRGISPYTDFNHRRLGTASTITPRNLNAILCFSRLRGFARNKRHWTHAEWQRRPAAFPPAVRTTYQATQSHRLYLRKSAFICGPFLLMGGPMEPSHRWIIPGANSGRMQDGCHLHLRMYLNPRAGIGVEGRTLCRRDVQRLRE